jgi:hypothetical protein
VGLADGAWLEHVAAIAVIGDATLNFMAGTGIGLKIRQDQIKSLYLETYHDTILLVAALDSSVFKPAVVGNSLHVSALKI